MQPEDFVQQQQTPSAGLSHFLQTTSVLYDVCKVEK